MKYRESTEVFDAKLFIHNVLTPLIFKVNETNMTLKQRQWVYTNWFDFITKYMKKRNTALLDRTDIAKFKKAAALRLKLTSPPENLE